MTQDNKRNFTVEIDGEEVEFAVLRPTFKTKREADIIYASSFSEAVRPKKGQRGALVRAAIESVMREQNLWDDEKQARFEELNNSIEENIDKLKAGGIKLAEARDIAVQIRRDRLELQILRMEYNAMDSNSAEAQAENARFNYYVAMGTVYADTGKPYFKDFDDYMSREDDDPVIGPAHRNMGRLMYGLDEYQRSLPENEFLLKYKFCDEKLHLVDKEGNKIDTKNRRVDDEGYILNEKGQRVNEEGELLDENGEVIVEFSPFLDDDGKPVGDKEPKPKKSRAKKEDSAEEVVEEVVA